MTCYVVLIFIIRCVFSTLSNRFFIESADGIGTLYFWVADSVYPQRLGGQHHRKASPPAIHVDRGYLAPRWGEYDCRGTLQNTTLDESLGNGGNAVACGGSDYDNGSTYYSITLRLEMCRILACIRDSFVLGAVPSLLPADVQYHQVEMEQVPKLGQSYFFGAMWGGDPHSLRRSGLPLLRVRLGSVASASWYQPRAAVKGGQSGKAE